MNNTPLVSILIPAYNVQDYAEEAIASLINQTYQNFEIIIVDDCSTDETLSILRRVESSDERIKVISKSVNSGIVQTLNIGLDYCSGDFIARMDADDIAMSNRLDEQVRFLLTHEDVDIVGSSSITINMKGEEKQLSKVPLGGRIKKTVMLFSPCFHIWMARVRVYKELQGYRPLAPAEDYDFLLRAFSNGFSIDNIEEPLMKIRCRDGNTADVAGLEQRKAHRYVVNLYKKRSKSVNKIDDFNYKDFKDAIGYTTFEKKSYDYSIKLIKKGFIQKSKLRRLYYFVMASLVSTWQFRYSMNRIIYKMMIKY